MCIAYLSISRPGWPLLIAANRDERHARASRAAAPWPQHPDLIAGVDLVAGGTWLGWCQAGGRFALLTNYREPDRPAVPGMPSRGSLVRDYLLGETAAFTYLQTIAGQMQRWAGFNLIAGDAAGVWYLGNRDPVGHPRQLVMGSHVLSNHLLDTPWPKARRLRTALDALAPQAWVGEPDQVFGLLHDTTPAPDRELPATGLPRERERLLSSPFIIDPEYGTRCSTVIAVCASGDVLFAEQTWDVAGLPGERHDWRLAGGCPQASGPDPSVPRTGAH